MTKGGLIADWRPDQQSSSEFVLVITTNTGPVQGHDSLSKLH